MREGCFMFKNFWYAVEFSKAVKAAGKPVPVRCLAQDFSLARLPSGQVLAWNVDRPADELLPVTEKYGFVWIFLGDPDFPAEERPPIPEWPEWDDPAFAGHNVTGEWLWNAGVERIVENGVDVAHTPFVHAGQFGNPKRPEVPDYEVITTDWSGELTVSLHPPAPKGVFSLISKKGDLDNRPPVVTSTAWFLPNLIRLKVRLPFGELCLYDTNIPIDKTTTLTKFVSLRSFFTGKWADRDALRRVYPIFKSDAAVVEAQRPELLPFDLSAELHVRSDRMAISYRKRRQELLEAGWGHSETDRYLGSTRALEAADSVA
jgi:phenylpropionate dioxygenase-like ring-hydroxylating dioxygenase large terminal subunit